MKADRVETSAQNAPEITVVMAAWNAAPFLARSVASALSQSGVRLEVIVADDASDDGTAALAEGIAAADGRVRVLRAVENGGPSAARNRAIAAAGGAWIAVLDADDRFVPGRLARLLAFAREREADLAFDLFREVDADGQAVARTDALRLAAPERWDLARWAEENSGKRGTQSAGYLKPLFRRAFLERHGLAYREALRNSEDYILVAECLAAGAAVWVSADIGYLYTRRAGSLSHRIGPAHVERLLAAERDVFAARRGGFDPRTRRALRRRRDALEDALALERIVAALKARSALKALRTLAARPQAVRVLWRWLGEVAAKRLPGRAGDA